MSLDAVAAYGKGMDQKSINELCTVFHALSHGMGGIWEWRLEPLLRVRGPTDQPKNVN